MSAAARHGALSLAPTYYDALRRLTLELAGINLGANHAFLVETRLARLARDEGYESLDAMVNELFQTGGSRLAIQVVSALTERDTHFFKDKTAFKRLREIVLPDLHHKRGGGRIRILSFGCASGQEPYGMAMVLDQMRDELAGMKVDIVGADYPSQALERAREGRYTHFDVQRGLPIRDLVKYFEPDNADWVIKDSIREQVEFRDIHLLSKLDSLQDFHAVMFCGSLPHYSAPARVRVLRGLSGLVKENGYLILGEGESLSQMNFGFNRATSEPGLYKKREVVLEPEIDPTIKVPNGRTTFDKTTKVAKSLKRKDT
ncbi:chemotaxis protein methyltransferase [Litorimonas cladophorae]|uniref:protein-glutamate O-methyltransferase n=1 Tax=Litorimonas cladophorae TaxID=1220491 RepID=A0A918KL71_9PROT|nr:CheR family methyltransferase [Litorimonas cladophorae]GGX65781.1 chemotaxis protein methyltransferase [Litorimonas cladophorae]